MKRIWALLILLSLGAPLRGQNFTGGFPFPFPPTDTSSSRFLPAFAMAPLTDQDFVAIDGDGHFSVRGEPIRFFGVNIVADAAFPAANRVWSVAGRLRKMGVFRPTGRDTGQLRADLRHEGHSGGRPSRHELHAEPGLAFLSQHHQF